MEQSDIKRPSAALINREWFDAASSVLSADQLGIVVVNACRYVFGIDMLAGMNQVQGAVFAMIRPALDSDIVKYGERCVRNAVNARGGSQRVAASGNESQRVGAITTTTSTTPTTTTPSLSPTEEDLKQIERDKWLIYGYFWSVGSSSPKDELNAFWSYYESLGWRNSKGAAIIKRLAAARMWRRQFETKQPKVGADAWFKVLQECPVADCGVWLCFMGAERKGDAAVVRLHCSEDFQRDLINALPTLTKTLSGLWRVQELTFERI